MSPELLLYTLHEVHLDKLARVIEDMTELGPPTIRAVRLDDHLAALEGVHRVEAASRLRVPVRLELLELDAEILGAELDWTDLDPGNTYSAGDLAREVRSARSNVYRIDARGVVDRVGGPPHFDPGDQP